MQPINPVPERSRQSPIALVFIIGIFLKRIAMRAWPLLLIFLKPSQSGGHFSFLLIVVLGMILVSLFSGLLDYYKFYFWLDENNLYVEQGMLKKSKVSIPFDRIQSINTEQSLFYRALNIVRLEIDTAGSRGAEVKIQAVTKEQALQIHDYVMSNKSLAPIDSTLENALAEEPELSSKWKPVLTLSLVDLLKIGLAQNHLRAIFIIAAFLFARFEDAREILGEKVLENIDTLSESNFFSDVLMVSFLVVFGILVSILVSLITVFARFYGFQLSESATGMKTESGLFTKRQLNLNFKRTQVFQYTAGPVRKLFGMYHVLVFQAAAEGASSRDAVQIPGCPANQLDAIQAKFFEGKETVEELIFRISRKYVFRKWLFKGFLMGVLLAVVCVVFNQPWFLLLVGLYMAYELWRNYAYYLHFRFGFSEDLFAVRSGFWVLKYRTIQLYKVQAVEIGQGIYQRKMGYADLVLYSAGGFLTIPYIELEQARLLQDYILFKVESTREKWM